MFVALILFFQTNFASTFSIDSVHQVFGATFFSVLSGDSQKYYLPIIP